MYSMMSSLWLILTSNTGSKRVNIKRFSFGKRNLYTCLIFMFVDILVIELLEFNRKKD